MKMAFSWILYVPIHEFGHISFTIRFKRLITNYFLLKLSTTTANRAQTLIPLLKERASGLPATFLTIDKLQELIDKLKQNVLEAQRRVDDAEQAYASSLSMTKLLGVFSRKDKTPAQDRPQGPLKVIDTKQEIAQIKADIKASSQTRTNSWQTRLQRLPSSSWYVLYWIKTVPNASMSPYM